jgi:hypothetical protein
LTHAVAPLIVFLRFLERISAGTPTVLDILNSSRQMSGWYLKLAHGHFRPHPFHLIAHCHPVVRLHMIWVTDSVLNKLQINKYNIFFLILELWSPLLQRFCKYLLWHVWWYASLIITEYVGWLDLLPVQLHTLTRLQWNTSSASVIYTLQFTVAHALELLWFTSRSLAMAFNTNYNRITVRLLHIGLLFTEALLTIHNSILGECNCDCHSTISVRELSLSLSLSHIATDGLPVCLSWYRAPSGAHDQIFVTVWQFLFCLGGGSVFCQSLSAVISQLSVCTVIYI